MKSLLLFLAPQAKLCVDGAFIDYPKFFVVSGVSEFLPR